MRRTTPCRQWPAARFLPLFVVTIEDVRGAEAVLVRIMGVLLVLVGLVLFASPRFVYTSKDTAIHTKAMDYKVERQRITTVPRPVAALIVAAGTAILVLASRRRGT